MIKKYFKIIIATFVVVLVPLIFTISVIGYLRISKIDPFQSESLKESLDERAWLFSILNIGRDFPYYNVSPSFEDIDPAMTQTSNVKGTERIVNVVSYDSITCMSNKMVSLSEDQMKEKLSSIQWSDCKFKKDFPWGHVSSNETVPKLDISISWLGILIIFLASFIVWCGFVSLIISTFEKIYNLEFLEWLYNKVSKIKRIVVVAVTTRTRSIKKSISHILK